MSYKCASVEQEFDRITHIWVSFIESIKGLTRWQIRGIFHIVIKWQAKLCSVEKKAHGNNLVQAENNYKSLYVVEYLCWEDKHIWMLMRHKVKTMGWSHLESLLILWNQESEKWVSWNGFQMYAYCWFEKGCDLKMALIERRLKGTGFEVLSIGEGQATTCVLRHHG
jgi:hypothetical protein